MALRYPNGRIRNERLALVEALRPGDQFDLYGRRWQAIGPAPVERYGRDTGRILCTSTGHIAPEPRGTETDPVIGQLPGEATSRDS